MLGLGIGIERVLSFVSVTLAARIGGPQAFGGYAVTLATAGAIAAYAGAGIGVTAVRFSGDYRPGSAGYRQFVKALGVIAICSALIAALFTFVGAGPIARWLLGNGDLAVVIRVAAISAGAMVLLDCCRGLLLGQQKFYGLLLLSLVSGVGLIVALPLASRIGATAMVTVQGSVALLTVIVFMVASPRLGIRPTSPAENDAPVPIRQVFAFGLVQFSAFAGISIATWCIASFVARADSSLKQMAFYSVANQWRGLAAMAPGLLTQVIYSSLTNKSSEPFGGPDRVLLSTTLITAILVMLCGGLAIVGLPWILPLVYGHRYAGAETAVSLLLATSIIHMSGQPAAQRLSIVRLRAIGIVNLIWSSLLIVFGFALIRGQAATGAAIAFLIAHFASNVLVAAFLYREKTLPSGYFVTIGVATIGALTMAALAYLRANSSSHVASMTAWIALCWLLAIASTSLLALRHRRASRTHELPAQSQEIPSFSEA